MALIGEKHALRQAMRRRRAAFVAQLSSPSPVLSLDALPPAIAARIGVGTAVAAYLAQRDELSPAQLLTECAARGATALLPWHADRTAPMRFVPWADDADCEVGPFGTQQPIYVSTTVHPDIILTPLLAFDAAGGRLGQGGGHYDRAFAEHPAAVRIGIGWSCQQVDIVPCEAHDVRLHGILTERGFTATAVA